MDKRATKAKSQKRLTRGDISSTELYTSSSIIKLLKMRGHKQTEIARLLGKSPSFVSHVNCNRRWLTIADLEKIERKTRYPVFLLLLEAADEATIPEDLKGIYHVAKVFFNRTTVAKFVTKGSLE